MSGQSVQGLLPVGSFSLLGVQSVESPGGKFLARKEVKCFMVPPPCVS